MKKICLISFLILLGLASALAQTPSPFPFFGTINSDNVNIRWDSRVSAEEIYKARKGERVEVVLELYDWYKVRLPGAASVFVRKDLAAVIEDLPPNPPKSVNEATQKAPRKARIIKESVNIRLRPNESAPILGKADKEEIVIILGEEGAWYRIDPPPNTFGWVHKKFVERQL